MQALQPQMKELQEKYKNDKQRLQQEMMRFYKENKVNPFASCIPLLAQLPVFITLFYVLQHELPADIGCEAGKCAGYGAAFFFINDLTAKATGARTDRPASTLYVGTQLISSMVMSITADKSQRMLMMLLPLDLRPLHPQLPGRPDPLLDHHQRLDDRAAAGDPESGSAAGDGDPRGGGRGPGGETASAAAAQEEAPALNASRAAPQPFGASSRSPGREEVRAGWARSCD